MIFGAVEAVSVGLVVLVGVAALVLRRVIRVRSVAAAGPARLTEEHLEPGELYQAVASRRRAWPAGEFPVDVWVRHFHQGGEPTNLVVAFRAEPPPAFVITESGLVLAA